MKKILLFFAVELFMGGQVLCCKTKRVSIMVTSSNYRLKVPDVLILVKRVILRITTNFEYYSQEELTLQYSRLPFVDLFSNPPGFSIFNLIPINTN